MWLYIWTCLLELEVSDNNYSYFILISHYEAHIKHLIFTTASEISIINIISILHMVKLRHREVKRGTG